MSDQSKKRCPSLEGSIHPAKRTKIQDGSSSAANEKTKPRTHSEYDDTGWLAPSEFTKVGGAQDDVGTLRKQLGLGDRPEHESTNIDPQKDCEEAVRLLREFGQKALVETGSSEFGVSSSSSSGAAVQNVHTINKQDLASLSCTDTYVAGSDGNQKDINATPQFESPSSLSSPALVIATTPPKKTGIKKRKLQSTSATTSQRRSQDKKTKVRRTPEKSSKLLKIATRQLIRKTPQKGSGQASGKRSTEGKSPRKSARIASLDHRISWKKGKKRIKKVKKKEKVPTSDDSDGDGDFESSYELAIDSDLEARLEENATKNNLTAINVKSILHHVITNEHVLQMVRNSMEEEQPKPGTPEKPAAVYEPKLTRSKLKEVTEKVGGNAVAWPLTPVKNPAAPVTQFAEIDFPEDSSEDEDYKPSQEDMTVDESDYESIASSQRSDFGSPCPGTPHSLSASLLEEDETSPHKTTPSTTPSTTPTTSKPVVKHIAAAAVPMGPPMSRPRVDKFVIKDDMNFLKQLDSYDAELKSIQENIAHRTRAKHPINQPVEEIEASFMPPDITHDMYDSDPEDKDDEWVAWLAGLNQPTGPESVEPPDDEQNDPEYNFLAEEETVDTEDFRDDKAVRVSKKELDELMDEIMEAYGNEVDLQQAAQALVPDQYNQPITLGSMIAQQRQASGSPGVSPNTSGGLTSTPVKGPAETGDAGFILMTDGERQQLQQQMQQHVQLLCQMTILSRACGNMQKDYVQAKKFLNELDYLANNFEQAVFGMTASTSAQPLPYYSFFRTCNLQDACDIANNPLPHQGSSTANAKNERNMAMPMAAVEVLANSTVFMYPELLPTCKLDPEKSKKLKFTDSEDNLLVFGLDQFRHFQKVDQKMKLIQEHMMPSKTVKQLLLHVKNMSAPRSGDNVIKLYRKHGVINQPPVPCEPVQPGTAIAPTQLYESRKPDWLKKYMQIQNLKTTEEMLDESKESTKTTKIKVKQKTTNKLSSEMESNKDNSGNAVTCKLVIHKMTRPAKKLKKKTVKRLLNIQPKIVSEETQESIMETGSDTTLFRPSGDSQANASIGQGIPAQGNPVMDQTNLAVGQMNPANQAISQPNPASGQDDQVIRQGIGQNNQVIDQPKPVMGQDNQVVGQVNPIFGQINQGVDPMDTSVPVAAQQVELIVQSETMQQSSSSLPAIAPVASTLSISPGGSAVQAAGVPLAIISPQKSLVSPGNTNQPPVYIRIAPNQVNAGFQNRLPINSQPKPSANPVNVGTSYQQVFTSVPAPGLRFQQPTVIIATPATPVSAPSIVIPSQPVTTNVSAAVISPGSVIQVMSAATTTGSTVASYGPLPPSAPHVTKILPKPKQPKRKQQKAKQPKLKQLKIKQPKPKPDVSVSNKSSQEEIDKANQLLDDVRKRISSGEENKASGKKRNEKGGGRKKRVKQTPEQKKAEEAKASKLLEVIKNELETKRKEKESQSSSGSESTTEPSTSFDKTLDDSDTQHFFPVLSPSPDPEDVDVNMEEADNEVNTDGPNHNVEGDTSKTAAIPDIMSPSTSGAGNQLTRRILFQPENAQSAVESAPSEQQNTETVVSVHSPGREGCQDDETESAMVVTDQKLGSQTELIESEATRNDSDLQSNAIILPTVEPGNVPQTSTQLVQTTVTSPLVRSQVQTVHTPSPPTQAKASTQSCTPTYVQSPIPAVNQSITVPNSNITFHSPPVSNFPPQLSVKDGKNTPSPASSVGKSPKGISALRNFKIDQGTVARQSPVTSPVTQHKPRTARKLIQGSGTSSPQQQLNMSLPMETENIVQPKQSESVIEHSVSTAHGVIPSVSQRTTPDAPKETDTSAVTQVLESGSNIASTGESGNNAPYSSSQADDLLCKEQDLSDDELKPLSKEEEEFCEDEDEQMEEEEEDEAMEDGGGDDDEELNVTPDPKEQSLNKESNPSEIVSPAASEKSTTSNLCTPPSNKPNSTDPSPSTKLAAEEDPPSPETEDALTSPEMKSKDGERRSSVTFEDSNSMETFQSSSNPHTNDGYEEGEEDAENADSNQGQFESSKKKKRSKRIAAKRIKTKLKKDLESTVVLLDPEIVNKDPLREERDDSFSKAYLKSVKEALKDDLPKYIEFLRVLNDFTDEEQPDMVKLYSNVCTVLADHAELIEEFTAFLPQEVASQCGVLIPNLEFAKARLFLRQVEVHFSKQPTHFQKILSLIIEWGSNEDRTNQQLKDLILPQLKSQPHLKQEFSLLFPDNIPPESHMMDFEYITLGDDKKQYDSFEEIEVSDSDEERHKMMPPPAAKKNTKKRKRLDGRKKRSKKRCSIMCRLDKGIYNEIVRSISSSTSPIGGVIDPWKGLNAELQYGTHSCKCNCHDRSLDLRVQRKVRHCAYCTAGVSRAELISTLKGLKTPARRPMGKSQIDMFDDNSNSIDGPEGMLASRKRPRGKIRKEKKDDSEEDAEDEDEDEDEEDGSKDGHEKRNYSEAVSHLSQMCDTLADTLNEHGNTSEDDDEEDLDKYTEDEKETDEEKETEYEDEKESCDDKETEDEDHDDEDDDDEDEDHDDEDDIMDDDVEDDMDVDDGVETGEDAEDELEDDDDDDEEDEEDSKKDVHKDEEIDAISGESHDAVGNSPYATSQESHSGESDSSNPASPHTPQSESEQKITRSDVQEETSQDGESKDAPAPESQLDAREEHLLQPPQISEQSENMTDKGTVENLERINVVNVTSTETANLEHKTDDLKDTNKSTLNVPSVTKGLKKDETCTGDDNTSTENIALSKDTSVEMPERTVETNDDKSTESCSPKDEKSDGPAKKDDNQTLEKIDKDKGASGDGVKMMPPRPDEEQKENEDVTPDQDVSTTGADGNETDTTIIWTREEDRLLLQSCQERDPSESLFTEIAEKMQGKTPKEVSTRFSILMQIFNSSQGEDDDDEDEDDEDSEEDGDDEDEGESDEEAD